MPLHPELPARRELTSRRTPPVKPRPPQRNPRRHGAALVEQLGVVQQPRSISTGVDPDLVFKMRSSGGRLAEDLLAGRGVTTLAETADYTYFVLTHDHGRQLAQALAAYTAQGEDRDGGKGGPLSSLFGRVEAIEPYGPADRRGPGLDDLDPAVQRIVVDVSIWPSDNYDEAARRAEIVRDVVVTRHGEVLHRDVRTRRTVLRVAVSADGLTDLLGTSVVERVRTPPVPYLDPSDWRHVSVDDLTLDTQPGEVVGVLDDAPADAHPLLDGLVATVTEFGPVGHTWQQRGHHGTLVVGRILLPHLQEQLRDHAPITAVGRVHVARILEPQPHNTRETRFGGGELGEPPHVVVERAIRALHKEHQVRVFNLSFGMKEAFDAVHVSELTEVLDELARELDIVIIVPTGNVAVHHNAELPSGHHAEQHYPSYLIDPAHRLAEPGPAALALTVGAVAHSDAPEERTPPRIGNKAIAGVGQLAPFSRTGPGVGHSATRSNKPDLVHDGGNWVLDDTNRLIQEDAGVAIVSTALDGSARLFRACCGTSFAAPAVARCAADVLHAYPRASANLVRALVASSAEEPPGATACRELTTRRRLYGVGRPHSSRAITSGARRVTMTYDGAMAVDTVTIHPLPVPEAFATGRSSTRRIHVVLAFDPPVRRQRREYLAGTMQLDLYRAVDPGELAEIAVRQDLDDPVPLIKGRRRVTKLMPGVDSVRSSTLHVRSWAPRQLNIDDGETYYIVLTHRTQTWARDRKGYPEQRYALAATLEDENRVNLDLYTLVTQQVRVPARVRIQS